MEGPSGVGQGTHTRAASYKKAQEGVSAGGGTRDTLAAEEGRARLLPNHSEVEAAQVIRLPTLPGMKGWHCAVTAGFGTSSAPNRRRWSDGMPGCT